MGSTSPSYKGHRYPAEIIAHCVWLYFRFPLSFCEVEELSGKRKYLWRAVDAAGTVLDILIQSRRDTAAARRFFRTLLKKTCAVPRVVVTDKLRSYGAAHREVMPSVEHRSHKGLNNRAENSHQPTRQRERAMKGFRSVGGAQRYLAAFSGISPRYLFRGPARGPLASGPGMTVSPCRWHDLGGGVTGSGGVRRRR
ncbi:IS6 family transposase [Streptomyces sp. NBC_01754]|uniref:IS6 family transposase n=1 Tax=Streptomyces sp. NBC_01754 TaxID=2975930 RepID=UPI003FA3D865